MTTGWKSILLKPVDPFFRKNGAGAEIRFKISGTRDDLHFGLDFHRQDEQLQRCRRVAARAKERLVSTPMANLHSFVFKFAIRLTDKISLPS